MLYCTKCEHTGYIKRDDKAEETHCSWCGNVNIDGVKPRYPIVKKESKNIELSKPVNPVEKSGESLQSPMQVTESTHKQEVNTMATCSKEGCNKKAWVKGYCAKHYTEVYGEPYKPPSEVAKAAVRRKTKKEKPLKPPFAKAPETPKQSVPETKTQVSETKPPKTETVTPNFEINRMKLDGNPCLLIPCNNELLKTINERAEREFRTPEQQAAWYLHQGMRACGL